VANDEEIGYLNSQFPKQKRQAMASFWKNLRHYYRSFGWRGVDFAVRSRKLAAPVEIEVACPSIGRPVTLRLGTSDLDTYEKIFSEREYFFEPASPPGVIVDAGANIGLASLYFAARFPGARIIAIEPEASNFALLRKNTAAWPAIIPVQAALWGEDTRVQVVDPGLDKWGFRARGGECPADASLCHEVAGITVDHLRREHGLDYIDIFKMDIEGGEIEVFAAGGQWLDRVGLLIAELHERYRPGCNQSLELIAGKFARRWQEGESVYLDRTGDFLKP
jgi:FkbM family methyltransferase